jgi:hypothetical protein
MKGDGRKEGEMDIKDKEDWRKDTMDIRNKEDVRKDIMDRDKEGEEGYMDRNKEGEEGYNGCKEQRI